MRNVLIAIRPQNCKQIIDLDKTIEVRKSKPKIDTPFKCFIYCTKEKQQYLQSRDNMFFYLENKDFIGGHGAGLYTRLNGKVIGEFVCDCIDEIDVVDNEIMTYVQVNNKPDMCITHETCLDVDKLQKYLNNKIGYGWHISDLVVYGKPKELSEFLKHDNTYDNAFGWAFNDKLKSIKIIRPSCSWCYVEEIDNLG